MQLRKKKEIQHCSVFNTYQNFNQITRRYQNAHAYVNAGFLLKVDVAQNYKVLETPRIVYGGINPKFVRLSQ